MFRKFHVNILCGFLIISFTYHVRLLFIIYKIRIKNTFSFFKAYIYISIYCWFLLFIKLFTKFNLNIRSVLLFVNIVNASFQSFASRARTVQNLLGRVVLFQAKRHSSDKGIARHCVSAIRARRFTAGGTKNSALGRIRLFFFRRCGIPTPEAAGRRRLGGSSAGARATIKWMHRSWPALISIGDRRATEVIRSNPFEPC